MGHYDAILFIKLPMNRLLCKIKSYMNIYEKLERLNNNQTKILQIKRYLLACCVKYIKYRSSGNLEKGIEVAQRFIAGRATWKQLHKYEWLLEGEAFGVEYYRDGIQYYLVHPDLYMQNDLRKIRIHERLSHEQAKEYLEHLAYFIVYIFSYCYRASNDLPSEKYNSFLCPILFKKYFKNSVPINA